MILDLLGDPIGPRRPSNRRRDNAHYSTIRGPEGETCGTCRHCEGVKYHDKTYFKCGLVRACWSHGRKTDIRKKDQACVAWEEIL
jgi:hypothetical protein